MAPDRVENTACFQGKSLEFVADWLEKSNLSKLKSVFKGTFIINMRTPMDGVHHKHRNISSAYLHETVARLYIKQRSQSSVLMKQAKKNSFKMLSSICSPDLFCPCANKTRGEEPFFFTRQQNASADRLFSSVFFFNVVSMFSNTM